MSECGNVFEIGFRRSKMPSPQTPLPEGEGLIEYSVKLIRQCASLTMSLDAKAKLSPIALDTSRQLRRSMTKAEKIFWERVRNRKFLGLKFRRQHPLFVDDDGRETFLVPDFYCHEKKLIVELDGGIHDTQQERNAKREELIRQNGLRMKKFKNEEVGKDIEGVMIELEKYVKLHCE